jgi:membrane-associated protein
MDMEISILTFLEMLLHVDRYLTFLIQNYGTAVYLIIFLIIFCETGLVVTPFLPGDSLIFVLGALAASGEINTIAIGGVLMLASILGNLCNYQIGRFIGPRAFEKENPRFFKKDTCFAPTNSLKDMVVKLLLLPGLCPSSAPSLPLWPASDR